MFKVKIKSFFMGVAVTAIVGTSISVATSQLQSISAVVGGIDIFIDGNREIPTNVNGDAVDPIIYDGTTYLPVRALTGMLTDKAVNWDGETRSVYIGSKPMAESTPIHEIDSYDRLGSIIETGSDAKFSILDREYTPFNSLRSANRRGSSDGNRVYMTNSNYRSINGKFVVPYTRLGSNRSGTIEFVSVDVYGEERVIDSFSANAGDQVMDIDVDITGVNILKIYTRGLSGRFYNITMSGNQ